MLTLAIWPSFGGWSRYWKRCVSFDSRQGTHRDEEGWCCFSRTTLKQFINREMDWLMWFASFWRAPPTAAPVRSPRSDPARSTNINWVDAPAAFRTSKLQIAWDRDDVWLRPVFDVFLCDCAARHSSNPCAADVTLVEVRFATSILVVTSLTRRARLFAQRPVGAIRS